MTDPDESHERTGGGELGRRLREEIDRRGPITFARFMERALYEPGLGYYRRPRTGPGLAGADFLTAPEAHPIFGAAIGRLLAQAWEAMDRPAPFVVSEPGAGTGALAEGLLGGLRDLGSPLLDAIRYRPIEVETARVASFVDRLERAGFGDRLMLDPPGADRETGAVVVNEVIDALPVHRVVGRPAVGGGLRELLVTSHGEGFAWLEGNPTTAAIAERLAEEGVVLADGQEAEVCLGLDAWLSDATTHLGRGVVVLVDYAEEPADLYRPARREGTLRAFREHMVLADPFADAGSRDLTATVDLAAVRAAASRAGLEPIGETTQAELLARTGGGALVTAVLHRPDARLQDALDLRSALARLMDPRGMGGFRVLAFGRLLPLGTTLPGLARIPRRGA